MKGDKVFLDTNLFVYLYSGTSAQQRIVTDILSDYDCYISTQVLNEFSNVITKKYKYTVRDTQAAIKKICLACCLTTISYQTILNALDIGERYGYSYYDCLIIASATENKCSILFSEDMADGQIVRGLTINNPFSSLRGVIK